MLYWEIVSRTAAHAAGMPAWMVVLYALVATSVVAYAQILREINAELAGR
ncbi:hypothetical protein [Kribbella sp. NPDC048928]